MRLRNSNAYINTLVIAIILFLVACFEVKAEEKKKVLPDFDQYPLLTVYLGKPALPNLSGNPAASKFKEEFARVKDGKPNFAGHYILVKQKSGPTSLRIAIMDAFTGDVYIPEALSSIVWSGKNIKKSGISYRLQSNLLIVYGMPDKITSEGIYFYVWKNNKATLIDQYVPGDSLIVK